MAMKRHPSNLQFSSFPEDPIFFDKDRRVPPYYLQVSCKVKESPVDEEADAAAGGNSSLTKTTSVLKRVSSFSIMSRVPSTRSLLSSPSANNKDKEKDIGNSAEADFTASKEGEDEDSTFKPSWRLRDRMKTVGVGLVMALNIGTDPPDIVKPHPCAKLQCWMDPSSITRSKAKEEIGERLEAQYARWQQQRAARPLKYRRALDPTVEDVRALCLWLRRQARHERILLHYNGHGVPRPTSNGEIWVFDKNHTEYIPLSVSDLRQWMGKPTIVVLDCSNAGILIPFLTCPVTESPPNTPPRTPTDPASPDHPAGPIDMETAASHWVKDTIVLCPTSDQEWLPMHPDYPADIFTSCLTTPFQIALRWFVRRNRHSMGSLNPEAVDAIPGQANDRKTPLGELNWIFTAVTDSIAWNVLPKPLFQRLFRQDLLVASMFRNFLLADRILRSLNCTPQSYPPLPPGTADHPLWQAWDLACETCLFGLLKDGILGNHVVKPPPSASSNPGDGNSNNDRDATRTPPPPPVVVPPPPPPPPKTGPASSISSPFFSEQLTAFEIWLEYASIHKDNVELLQSPEQLPVVLQVLLSQVHRIRALELLRRFLELGPWAVNLSLSLGIFPYVMKLLQSPEYKSLLLNIWASILKFDPSCQVDLVKDGALPHFIQPLTTTNSWTPNHPHPSNQMEFAKQRIFAAFSLASTCFKYPQAQTECLRQNLHGHCCTLLMAFAKMEEQIRIHQQQQQLQQQQQQNGSNGQHRLPNHLDLALRAQLLSPTARVWLCLCLGNLVQACPPAQRQAFHSNVHVVLMSRLEDKDSHVRAAATYAIGCLIEYAPDLPPPTPPAMSLGPVMGPPMGGQTFPGRQPMLGIPQHMSAITMTVPAALTASAVLSGRLQSTIPNLGPGGGGGRNPAGPANNPMFLQPAMPQLQVPGAIPPPQMQPSQMQQNHPIPQMQPQPMQLQPMQPQHLQPQQMQLQPAPQQGRPQTLAQHGAQVHAAQQLTTTPQGLRLGGQPLAPTGAPLLQQQNLLRPQGGLPNMHPMMAGPPINVMTAGRHVPLGNPMAPMASSQGLLMNPMPPPEPQQPRRRPTVYDDRRRIELDLSLVWPLLKRLTDGSSVVRYEAVMALCNFVEKYMQAFLVVAEESTSHYFDDAENSDDSSRVVPIPGVFSRVLLDRFANCWKALRAVQHGDSHPNIAKPANALVSIVHEQLLDMTMEKDSIKSTEEKEGGLSGIQEEAGGASGGDLERIKSGKPFKIKSPDSKVQPQLQVRSDGPLHRLPTLRRTASEQAVQSMHAISTKTDLRSILLSPQGIPPIPDPSSGKPAQYKKEYSLPKSKFYEWKKETFKSIYDDSEDDDMEDRDPLNPSGAARAYLYRRNALVREIGRDLANHFVRLKPKAQKKKTQLDILWDSDEEADEKDLSLKGELKLREKKLLRNTGVKMTSMLKFHSYEDILMVCDNEDGISIWDYEKGLRSLSYKNGNPKGSRMTTAFWMNESSTSLFCVGSDDGSVRIWDGVVESNRKTSRRSPTLTSAFFPVPDMKAGQRGSGLVCEWQQFSGSLIAGGNSNCIRCWDLSAEQCTNVLETDTEACVTALSTAWDAEIGTMSRGSNGMGPDVLVAGHGDGSLKVFDIRSTNPVAEVGGRPRRHSRFTEHGSWVVDTAFTSYGGSFEIISGSVGGDIRAWDLRMSSSLRTLDIQRSPMTALSVHKQIPIVATGSHAQFIKIVTLEGETLQVARFHEEMSGHRIGPVSCLEFHKQKLVLAAGATNSLVSIYKPKTPCSI